MDSFHPDLRRIARLIPRFSFGPVSAFAVRGLDRLAGLRKAARPGLTFRALEIPGPEGAPPVGVRVFRPEGASGPLPALLWLHGGGFIVGSPAQDDAFGRAVARKLGMVVVAVDYRLAPRHPFPAPLEDCYAALRWLHSEAAALEVRPDRIAVGGGSAGGGLAACLCLMARDRKEVPVAMQLLVYPMLDDRTAARTDVDETNLRLWTQTSNRYGWTSYLGRAPGSPEVSAYAAAARAEDLRGLPPTWLGVGTLDLFHDEGVAYAKRLRAQGVPCTLEVVVGAYHGFDVADRKAPVVRAFFDSQLQALRAVLFADRTGTSHKPGSGPEP